MKTPSLVLIAIVALHGFANLPAAESIGSSQNSSLANDRLSRDTLRGIKTMENGLRLSGDKGIMPFGMPKVIRKQVLVPIDGAGVWIEEWSIQRIGYVVDYAIKFMPSPKGGTDSMVLNPVWKNDGRLDSITELAKVDISQAKWIDGVVGRTRELRGKYTVQPKDGTVTVIIDTDLDPNNAATVSQNLKQMTADLLQFYGKAPVMIFKFRNAEVRQ